MTLQRESALFCAEYKTDMLRDKVTVKPRLTSISTVSSQHSLHVKAVRKTVHGAARGTSRGVQLGIGIYSNSQLEHKILKTVRAR